ncbi:ATP-grasp domain-containing protein [Streptomyces sp. URMC 124]|uniref:ATP-grasp domain-containing protein n=1 Tax=Streptomyces sp. URMC 124 TaxID=3423405 RepID=UPI003F1B76AF
MRVETLPPSADPADLCGGGAGATHYYGGPLFAARVRDRLGLCLLEPADEWLAELPRAFSGRAIRTATLAEARALAVPAFVKPPTAKSFPAAVYGDGSRLPAGPGLSSCTPVQISEVVAWHCEVRLFLLDGEVRTGSQYAVFGRLDAVPLDEHPQRAAILDFAARLTDAAGHTLPSAVVVDVGLMSAGGDGPRWAVVEANMAWFSSCYAADPDAALDVVLRAAGPAGRVAERDRPFSRLRADQPTA